MPALSKRDALIAEGLSEGEADYMTSGGTKTEGLTPPADDTYVGDADDRPGGQQQTQQTPPADQLTPPPADEDPDNPPPPQNSPFYPQWQREKRRRQDLAEQLRTRDADLTAEREKWARLDERMRLFREAMEQPEAPPQPRQKPDRESDPFGYMAWMEEELDSLRQNTEQAATQQRERDTAAELTSAFKRDAATYARSNPDFWETRPDAGDGAYHYLLRNRDAELQAAGYHDPQERMRIIAADERDIVARAFHARQQNPRAPAPSEVLFNLAVSRGYQRRQAGAPAGGAAQPGNAPPAGAPRQNGAPSVTEQVQQIQRGQAASRSLSSAGGAPIPQGIDLASIASMDDMEYETWKRGLTPAQRGEYHKMIGYVQGR